MSDTWITNIRDFLNKEGSLPELSGPSLNNVLHLGSIVGWASSRPPAQFSQTNVTCRRSPARRRCPGTIVAMVSGHEDEIVWHCPVCGDNGVIHGWQGTRWDRRGE